jgi:trk system potassium uptake protein TrkH
MNLGAVQRIFGMLLMIFSLTMLPPVGVAVLTGDAHWQPFADASLIVVVTGALLWWPARFNRRDLRLRDGFLVVALFWIVLGVAGAVPLVLTDRPAMSLTDAVFEAVSGFTTTGATTLVGLDDLPPSLLYYRQQIQWLGGIGIVVLAVALLPMLGVGGMQLLKAETPGPVKDTKLTPRITQTAKALWLLYLTLTVLCTGSYWLAGMSLFDAVGHAFATVSSGGYSTHDASLAHFDNLAVELVAVVFMIAGGVNFSLHFTVWRYRRVRDYVRDPEFRAYLLIMFAMIALATAVLVGHGTYRTWGEGLRRAVVQAVSVQTSTGFTTADFSIWPGALPVLLIFVSFVGGSAGSTAGGMKVIRWLLIARQGAREIMRLIHPNATLTVKLGGKPVDRSVIDAVWGFFATYVTCFAVLMVALMSTGANQVTAFSAIATCMNNLGPGLGDVASNFTSMSAAGKWICITAMLLGRLEIFPILVLLSPSFWRP